MRYRKTKIHGKKSTQNYTFFSKHLLTYRTITTDGSFFHDGIPVVQYEIEMSKF